MNLLNYVSQNVVKASCLPFRHLFLSRVSNYLHQLPVHSFCASRKCSTKVEKWKPFYRFPYIVPLRAVNRLKLHQTFLSVVLIPVVSIMHHYDVVDFAVVKILISYGIISSLTLFPITWFFRKAIGIMYVSEDGNLVQISHLTFWGNRKNIIVPKEDIIPLSDCEYNPNDAYVTLQRFSVPDVLFFTLRYGQILSKKEFEDIFGEVKVISNKK